MHNHREIRITREREREREREKREGERETRESRFNVSLVPFPELGQPDCGVLLRAVLDG